MKFAHTLSCAAALFLGFSFSGARAAEVQQGKGLICDTQAQVEKYVQIADQADALQKVNADSPTACAIVNMVYVEGAEVSRVSNAEGCFRVVNVLVVGVVTPQGIQRVAPLEQYILVTIPTHKV